MTNPSLNPAESDKLVQDLMAARRAVKSAKRVQNTAAEDDAHAEVDRTKRSLGERGPVWWEDGAPDYNRKLVCNTPYAIWYDDSA